MRETNTRDRFIEAAWKTLLSSSAILPIVYQMAPERSNLLPASFDTIEGDHVRTPPLLREGSNVRMLTDGGVIEGTGGPYSCLSCIYQELAELADFDGRYPTIGSWLVGDKSSGIDIRADVMRSTSACMLRTQVE